MKASEVKATGYYWYLSPFDRPPVIVEAAEWSPGKWTFFDMGNEMDSDPEQMPGEFFGPLTPPTT